MDTYRHVCNKCIDQAQTNRTVLLMGCGLVYCVCTPFRKTVIHGNYSIRATSATQFRASLHLQLELRRRFRIQFPLVLTRKIGNMKISVVLVLSLILEIGGFPQKASIFAQRDNQKSKVPFPENVISRKDGKIVFPLEKPDGIVTDQALPTPVCKNDTFCEDPPNYPSVLVDVALRMNRDLQYFPSSDMVPEINNRARTQQNDAALCQSYEAVIYPKAAENINNELMFVVNQANFRQGVRVERCKQGVEKAACDLIDDIQVWFTTTCKQKYIYRQLVAISSTGEVKPETFRFPASCCCHVKRDAKFFEVRMAKKLGMKTEKKSEV